jgi:hypothetical protein
LCNYPHFYSNCRHFFISLSNQVPLPCPFVSNLFFSCCPYSVFYVALLWFHVTLTGLVFSFNIISHKYAALPHSNCFILKHCPSEFVTAPIVTRFKICVHFFKDFRIYWQVLFTVWQGAWKHLRTTSFHIQHSYDRSEAAQSQLLTERPSMHWQTPQQRQEHPLQNVLFFALYQRTVQAYTYR